VIIAAYGTREPAKARELWSVYLSTIAIAAALLVPIAIHPLLFILVVAAGAYRGVTELAAVYSTPIRGAWREGVAACAIAAVALGASQEAPGETLLYAATLGVVAATSPLYLRAFREPPSGFVARVLALAFPLVAAAHLAHLAAAPDGFAWIVVLYATVETQDSAAYLFGKLFGRRLVFPRLSPKKTLAGAVCGALCSVAVGAFAASLLLAAPPLHAAALAGLVTTAGFCGDLYTSALKRGAGVKDFPSVHRLHGGILDIYDSTLFAAVALSAALYIIGSWTS
jgi:phosphatidate cytidylyltransferase